MLTLLREWALPGYFTPHLLRQRPAQHAHIRDILDNPPRTPNYAALARDGFRRPWTRRSLTWVSREDDGAAQVGGQDARRAVRSAPGRRLVSENCSDRPGGPHREEALMARVICDMSTSLDGYVTGPNDSRENPFGDGAGMLHDWLFDAATDEDRAILQDMLDNVGAIVMGRTSFDKNEGEGGWGDGGPAGDIPCFVVTHNMPTRTYSPIYTFVTDGVASGIEQAKHVAGDKVVGLHGATVMQQGLPLGLVDEIRVHVIPVLLGGGTPLFSTLDSAISLERTRVRATPAATHLEFRVVQ